MFEASRKIMNLIWVGIAALISLIAGFIMLGEKITSRKLIGMILT